ncbi:MAG: hypothetical protein KF824_00990 [Fimbriimonadaceae bacterium]|nr:MAG: hypothetical protein KF824_00990 [Fimbriimonadaceae bacterium]
MNQAWTNAFFYVFLPILAVVGTRSYTKSLRLEAKEKPELKMSFGTAVNVEQFTLILAIIIMIYYLVTIFPESVLHGGRHSFGTGYGR